MISPELLFWYELALKMALTAIVVVITSIVVERSGAFVGAMIAALPTAAGAAWPSCAPLRRSRTTHVCLPSVSLARQLNLPLILTLSVVNI